jgi:hypothetical protein
VINDFENATNLATIESGNLALRYAVLINGGAAIAILGFISALAGQGKVSVGPNLTPIAFPLTYFALGVAAATLGMGFTYFANLSITYLANSLQRIWKHPYSEATESTAQWLKRAEFCRWTAVLLATASLGLFIWGMLSVKDSISHLGIALLISITVQTMAA